MGHRDGVAIHHCLSTYLLNRNKLQTIEGTRVFYWATVVLGAIVIVLFVLGIVGRAALRAR
jgi:hypothetical protein